MSMLSRLQGGKKPARKASGHKATARHAPKHAVKHTARRTVKHTAHKTVRHVGARKLSAESRAKRRIYMRDYMRGYRLKLKQKGFFLNKHGRALRMTAEQKARWRKRAGKHAKNWNKRQSTSKINAEKRGERKSALVRKKKARHGRKLSAGLSLRNRNVSLKGNVRGYSYSKRR